MWPSGRAARRQRPRPRRRRPRRRRRASASRREPGLMTAVDVGGRQITLSNLDKVLYPEAGFTKAEVIDYYHRIAPVMIPHLAGRALTLRRWPNGVDAKGVFETRCPSHRPPWLPTAPGPGDHNGTIDYCRFGEPAARVWAANMAALELHA